MVLPSQTFLSVANQERFYFVCFYKQVYVGDVCVPISELPCSVSNAEKLFKKHNFPCTMCCHIADGNFHCLIPFNDDNEKNLHELEHQLITDALAVGGVCSGKHGIGVGKMQHLISEHGEAHVTVQRSIKKALDPLNIMNPGKFIHWSAKEKRSSQSRSKL